MKKGIMKILEITPHSLKAVASQEWQGKRMIVLAESIDLEQKSDETLVKDVKQLLHIKRRGHNDILVLSRKDAIFLRLSLPSSKPEEMRKMLELQFLQHIPYDPADVVFDFHILKERLDGYVDVLVVVLLKERVLEHIMVLQKAGLYVNNVIVSSFGLLETFYRHLQRKNIDSVDPVILLYVDQNSSEICFCQTNHLLYSRYLSYGWEDLDSDNEDIFLNQVGASIKMYNQQKFGPGLKSIWTICLKEKYPRIGTLMLNIASLPIHWIPYGEDADEDYLSSLANDYQAKNSSLATLHGLALAEQNNIEHVNLLPNEISQQRRDRVWHAEVIKCGVFILLMFFLFIGSLVIQRSEKKEKLDAVSDQVKQIRPLVDRLNEKKDFINLIEDYQGRKVFLPDVYLSLTEVIEEDVFIKSLQLRKEKTMELEGYALVDAEVNRIQKQLSRLPYFKDIHLKLSRKRRISRREVVYFNIELQLKSKEEQDEEKLENP